MKKFDNLESEFEDLKKSLTSSGSSSSSSAEVSKLSTEIESLTSELGTVSSELDALTSKVSSLTSELSTLSSELDSEISSLSSALSTLDESVVHTSGDENISGTKTFTTDVYVNSEKVMCGLYHHSIVLKRTLNNSISFSIINHVSVAMEYTEVAQWLLNHGFTSTEALLPATGSHYTGTSGSQYVFNGVYSETGEKVVGRYYNGVAEGINTTNTTSWTLFDIVVPLADS